MVREASGSGTVLVKTLIQRSRTMTYFHLLASWV